MKYSRQKHKSKPGRPVRGSIHPFRNTELEKMHQNIMLAPTPGQLTEYRNVIKDAIAQTALAKFSALRRPVEFINDQCCRLIHAELATKHQNPHVASFVCCTMDFFNNTRPRLTTINKGCAIITKRS